MSAVWAVSSVPAFAKVEDANLSQIKEKIAAAEMKPVRSRKIVPVWLKVAAAIILLLGCNYFWYTYTENLTEVYTNADSPYEIKVPAGSRTNIVLPDGTEVSLNAGSVLRYCRGFGIRERDVTLDGEGYFKVAKNEKIPFFVNTNGVQVKVVGTVFNVRAYDDDNYVMVSLLEGRVNLATLSGSVMKLFPSEQAFYDKNTGPHYSGLCEIGIAGGRNYHPESILNPAISACAGAVGSIYADCGGTGDGARKSRILQCGTKRG